jgi:hemerythrin-like domain-containing protein
LLKTDTTLDETILLLEREQGWLLYLCNQLETFADSLPAGFDQARAICLLQRTEAALRRHISLQEGVIFPTLIKGERARKLGLILGQLEYEHSSDSALILETIETVMTQGFYARVQAERFGCLLRHFFEGHRRHLAWETQVLDPFVRAIGYIAE